MVWRWCFVCGHKRMKWDIHDRRLRCQRCGDTMSMYIYKQLRDDMVSQQNYKRRRLYGKTEAEIGEEGAAKVGAERGRKGYACAGECRGEAG